MLYTNATGCGDVTFASDVPSLLRRALRLPAIDGIEVPISMHLPVPKVLPQRRHKHPHLIHTPPKPPGHQRQAHRLAPPAKVLVGQPPDLLVVLVFGPRVGGPLELLADDVDVAGLLHQVGEVVDDAEGEAEFVGGLVEVGVPLYDGRVLGDGAVVAVDVEVDVVELEVAAGLEVSAVGERWFSRVGITKRRFVLETLAEVLGPVLERT